MDRAKDRILDNVKGKNLVVVLSGVNDVLNLKWRHLRKLIDAEVAKLWAVSERVRTVFLTISEVKRKGRR